MTSTLDQFLANNDYYYIYRQLMQQQIVQQQLMLNQQARSQEMLASTPHVRQPQALGADALYQQYGPPGRRSAMYQRDLDVRSMANFTSLKTGPQSQVTFLDPNSRYLLFTCIYLNKIN